MKKILKSLGVVGGGTAAACAACCAAPSLLTPLLTWLGFTGAGLAYSPWLALVIALPAMMLGVVLFRRRMTASKEASTICGCENMCSAIEGQKSACR